MIQGLRFPLALQTSVLVALAGSAAACTFPTFVAADGGVDAAHEGGAVVDAGAKDAGATDAGHDVAITCPSGTVPELECSVPDRCATCDGCDAGCCKPSNYSPGTSCEEDAGVCNGSGVCVECTVATTIARCGSALKKCTDFGVCAPLTCTKKSDCVLEEVPPDNASCFDYGCATGMTTPGGTCLYPAFDAGTRCMRDAGEGYHCDGKGFCIH